MRNYLTAECYKVFLRKYFYLTLLAVLVLEGLLSTVRAQMERDSDPEEAENGKPKQS